MTPASPIVLAKTTATKTLALPVRATQSRFSAVSGAVSGAAAGAALLGLLMSSSAADARNAPDSFADLASAVTPAVVNIQVTQTADQQNMAAEGMEMPGFPPGSPFEEFFRRHNQTPQQGGKPQKVTGLGSGFVIDASGYVVTNNHVVGKSDDIMVTMQTGEKYKARLVGRDEKTDLALLKVDAGKPLPAVAWGDSDKSRVGDWVLAVGNPFGLGGTVTAGIISARGRDIQSGPYDDYLQLDAAINRGNSGGPSFDSDGKVIGINTAIYSPSGGSVGIGFAIPSATAKTVIAELKDKGQIARGWLGVQIQPLDTELAETLGLDKDKGALVAGVTPDSPAAKAGLKPGDVIVGVDGKSIGEMRELPRLIAANKPDAKVALKIWRDGKEIKETVQLASAPSPRQVADAGTAPLPQKTERGTLGLILAPVNAETRSRYNLDADAKGVMISGVLPDSDAADKGLKAGDVILQIGRDQVASPEQAVERVKAERAKGKDAVVILVARGEVREFIAVKFAKA